MFFAICYLILLTWAAWIIARGLGRIGRDRIEKDNAEWEQSLEKWKV